MQLFFVYDTVFCKKDADDPKDAVVYFYPAQACETQRYSLCCQLVGIAKFVTSMYASPSVVVLEQGKFVFQRSETYLLVLGSRSEVPSSILKKQLLHLCGIFFFYHGSITSILEDCDNNREVFMEKLEIIWSHCLNWSQCFGNPLQFCFNALPLTTFTKLPSIAAKASQLLQMCQLTSSVNAGVILCHNRVLTTQLTPELTCYLTLMSNSNVSSSVRDVTTSDLPPGVQLKYVYLTPKELKDILKYNHKTAGNAFRIRPPHSKSLPSNNRNLSSGSEGDIDSGNCSESLHRKKVNRQTQRKDSDLNLIDSALLLDESYKSKIKNNVRGPLPSKINGHKYVAAGVQRTKSDGRAFQTNEKVPFDLSDVSTNVSVCRKNSRTLYLKYDVAGSSSNDINSTSKNSLATSSFLKFGSQQQQACTSIASVLCDLHSLLRASKFACKPTNRNDNHNSISDAEFRCLLCKPKSRSYSGYHKSLKRWNSETDILQSSFQEMAEPALLAQKHFVNSVQLCSSNPCLKRSKENSKCHRLQILKCRSKSDNSYRLTTRSSSPAGRSRKKHLSAENPQMASHSKNKFVNDSTSISSTTPEFPTKSKYGLNGNLHKTVLYVQKCGSSSLLLLLNDEYDKKVLNYLWNCGFSVLKDLEFDIEKESVKEKCEAELSYSILLYNKSQKTLKEDKITGSSLFLDNNSRESVQNIHEDFQGDPDLHSISILSSDRSIFACHSKHHSAFYVQADASSRKIETLCSLSKKVLHRVQKSFNIAFEHNMAN